MTLLLASITMVGSSLHLLTGGLLIIWCIMVFSTMRPVNRSMIEAIKLNYELGLEIEKRIKVEEQLLELSIKDGLTGLFNRRHFDESYAKELKLAQSSKAEISIALIDIDYFKQFNDTYGHQAGDDCLCKVSEVIKHSVNRPNDIVARYGGEEFVVLMPNTSNEQAIYLAECMRNAVEKLEIAHKNSKVANTATVSVSIGTATLEPNVSCDNIELLNFADKALYQAKDQGRNQTVFFDFKL
jgi:diguanylate cyclase (GGDEF)-like protein